jgi:hypothetical protein
MQIPTLQLLALATLALPGLCALDKAEVSPPRSLEGRSPQQHLQTPLVDTSGTDKGALARVYETLPSVADVYDMVYTYASAAEEFINAPRRKRCARFRGSIGGVTYRYLSMKEDCDTSREQIVIRDAVRHHLKTEEISETRCLDLRKNGLANGFLLIGPTKTFDSKMYCGPTILCDGSGLCGNEGTKKVE